MKVLIIAGGKGTRIQDVSTEIPKALLPINGKPIAEHQIELLIKHGFDDFTFCIGYLGEQIQEHFGDGSKWGVKFNYLLEETPLGTGGAIKNGASNVDGTDDILILFGDIMMDMDISKMVSFHTNKKAILTFAVHTSDHPEDSSNVLMDDEGRIESIGRPKHGHPLTGITRTSIQIINRRILDYIPDGKVSFEDKTIPILLENKEPVYGYYTDEFIKDVGTPKRYKEVGGNL